MPHGPTNQPTKRQAEAIAAIRSFQSEHGYGPSIADLARGLAISPSAAVGLITALRLKRLVATSPGVARSLRVLDAADSHSA